MADSSNIPFLKQFLKGSAAQAPTQQGQVANANAQAAQGAQAPSVRQPMQQPAPSAPKPSYASGGGGISSKAPTILTYLGAAQPGKASPGLFDAARSKGNAANQANYGRGASYLDASILSRGGQQSNSIQGSAYDNIANSGSADKDLLDIAVTNNAINGKGATDAAAERRAGVDVNKAIASGDIGALQAYLSGAFQSGAKGKGFTDAKNAFGQDVEAERAKRIEGNNAIYDQILAAEDAQAALPPELQELVALDKQYAKMMGEKAPDGTLRTKDDIASSKAREELRMRRDDLYAKNKMGYDAYKTQQPARDAELARLRSSLSRVYDGQGNIELDKRLTDLEAQKSALSSNIQSYANVSEKGQSLDRHYRDLEREIANLEAKAGSNRNAIAQTANPYLAKARNMRKDLAKIGAQRDAELAKAKAEVDTATAEPRAQLAELEKQIRAAQLRRRGR